MSIIVEQLTHILAEARISSSQEEEILIVAKRFTTTPKVRQESTFEELCTSYEEQLCEKKIKKDEQGILGDQNHEEYHANESCIEQWFQVNIRLDQFCFHLYFINSHFQHLIFHIMAYSRFSFSKLNLNLCLLLLDRWLHWKFHFM